MHRYIAYGVVIGLLLVAAPSFGGTVTEVATGDVNGAYVITFESVAAPTAISGTDPLFVNSGISSVAGSGGTSGDVQNQTGKTGNALFTQGTQLYVLPEADSTPFGPTSSFTIDLARKHSYFGVSFQDQTGQNFTLTFYDGTTNVGSITKSIGSTATTQFNATNTDQFDRVVITGDVTTDGWGIDNILTDAVREISLADFDRVHVIDFESVSAPTTFSGTDPLFTKYGLRISATGGAASGDVSSVNNANDNALYYNGSDLLVLPDSGFSASSWPFGANQEFILDFANDQKRLGIVFGDQAEATFEFTFFLDGQQQAVFTRDVANVNAATMYFETDFSWDRVIIDSLRNDDGFGIDNITFENAPEPAVTTLLAGLALLAVPLLRRRKRR